MTHSRASRHKQGVVLLDVVLGLTILAIAGLSWVALMGQTFESMQIATKRDRELGAAGRVLDRMAAAWSIRDFQRSLGRQASGAFVIQVDQVAPGLYDVTVLRATPLAPLLTTTFYPTDSGHAR